MSTKMISREHNQTDFRICILWMCDVTVHSVFYQNFYHCLFFWWKHILWLCISMLWILFIYLQFHFI